MSDRLYWVPVLFARTGCTFAGVRVTEKCSSKHLRQTRNLANFSRVPVSRKERNVHRRQLAAEIFPRQRQSVGPHKLPQRNRERT